MQFLKADTVATILIGPFLDKGDGVTPETGVTLGAADSAELMKHDGTTFVDLTSDSRTFTHKERGMYTLILGIGDTDTEGRLTVFISDESVCLPVWKDFMVVNANVYDSLFAAAATDYLQVDALQLGGATQSATDLKDFADTGYNPSTHKVAEVVTLTGHTAQTGDSYARIGAAGASLTDLGGMASGMKAEVNAEVADVITTDTISELSQAAPTATPTVETALMLLYMIARNKLTTTSTELGVYNDAGTKIAKKTLGDDGTTYTEDEMASGA